MTRLHVPPNASEPEAATTSSDRTTPTAKVAKHSASSTDQTYINNRRRPSALLPQLQPRRGQLHVHELQVHPNVAAAPSRSQSRSNNPEALQGHSKVLVTSTQQNHLVHRIGSGSVDDGSSVHHHAAASSAAGPPSPPRCSNGQPSWPSPVKFQPEPSRIIRIRSDPTLSCGCRIRQRGRGGNANSSSWDYDDENEDHEGRAEDERMYDLATWRMYHRIMEARRRQAENSILVSHCDADVAPTAQDIERMVLHVKEQATATYQSRLAIMEDAIAITSITANTDDHDGAAEHYYGTMPTHDYDGPPSLLTSAARSPRDLMRMLDRARRISIGAENDTQSLFTMDM